MQQHLVVAWKGGLKLAVQGCYELRGTRRSCRRGATPHPDWVSSYTCTLVFVDEHHKDIVSVLKKVQGSELQGDEKYSALN